MLYQINALNNIKFLFSTFCHAQYLLGAVLGRGWPLAVTRTSMVLPSEDSQLRALKREGSEISQQTFCVKGQLKIFLAFQAIWSLSQFCHCSTKAVLDNTNGCDCVPKTIIYKSK